MSNCYNDYMVNNNNNILPRLFLKKKKRLRLRNAINIKRVFLFPATVACRFNSVTAWSNHADTVTRKPRIHESETVLWIPYSPCKNGEQPL